MMHVIMLNADLNVLQQIIVQRLQEHEHKSATVLRLYAACQESDLLQTCCNKSFRQMHLIVLDVDLNVLQQIVVQRLQEHENARA